MLICELSDDDESDKEYEESGDFSTAAVGDLAAPWCKDFNGYLQSKDQLGDLSIVEWWGVHIIFLYDHADS